MRRTRIRRTSMNGTRRGYNRVGVIKNKIDKLDYLAKRAREQE